MNISRNKKCTVWKICQLSKYSSPNPHCYVHYFSAGKHRGCICHFHVACHLLTHFPKWITMTKRRHCFLANLSSSSKQILTSRNNSALFLQQSISSGSNLQWTPFSLSILQCSSWFMTGTGDWPLKPCQFPGSEARHRPVADHPPSPAVVFCFTNQRGFHTVRVRTCFITSRKTSLTSPLQHTLYSVSVPPNKQVHVVNQSLAGCFPSEELKIWELFKLVSVQPYLFICLNSF